MRVRVASKNWGNLKARTDLRTVTVACYYVGGVWYC